MDQLYVWVHDHGGHQHNAVFKKKKNFQFGVRSFSKYHSGSWNENSFHAKDSMHFYTRKHNAQV